MSLQENRAACAACLACNRESAVPTFCGPGKRPEQSRGWRRGGRRDPSRREGCDGTGVHTLVTSYGGELYMSVPPWGCSSMLALALAIHGKAAEGGRQLLWQQWGPQGGGSQRGQGRKQEGGWPDGVGTRVVESRRGATGGGVSERDRRPRDCPALLCPALFCPVLVCSALLPQCNASGCLSCPAGLSAPATSDRASRRLSAVGVPAADSGLLQKRA